MAKKWVKTLTSTEVGFEVLSVRPAERKPGYVVTTVKYPTVDHTYEYCRKANDTINMPSCNSTVIDGCEVTYDYITFEVRMVKRIYDTAGLRKAENPGGANKTGDKIKVELENKGIEVPSTPKMIETLMVKVPTGEIHHEKYETIKMCLASNIPVYLAGPAGSGKNHTVEQIAKELGWDFYFSNSVQQEYKLTGFIDAGGEFHDTEFYKACTSEDDCIFFLDEMDASIPEVLVLLNAAIANGYFEFPNGRVNLKHVHFVSAGNTMGSGADEMYTGRMVLDQATLDRFAIIEFDYSMAIELALSKGNTDLVTFIRQLRKESADKGIRATFSYRCITMVTKLEKAGMPQEEIMKVAVVKGLDKDTIKTLIPSGYSKYHEALRKVQRVA